MHAMAGTGRVIAGRYRLKEPIGRGAMGTVWCGWDEILDREVAVKELRISEGLPDDERAKAIQRTHREARTAARLSHPGLVTVFDVAEEDGCPWIIMELVHARSLDEIIAQDGPLSPVHAADAGRQLLAALATAHAAGVLHRDVKPSNVMVTEAGRAVLTDFGIATFQGDPRLTQTGMVMGSPGFTAPERIQGNPATPASDLWSLGATLYAAVEGHGPFDRAGGAITTMSAIINTDPPTAPIAAGLGTVIDGLLRRNPEERPDAATAARMLGAIGPLPDGSMSAGGYTPTAASYGLPRQATGSGAGEDGAVPLDAAPADGTPGGSEAGDAVRSGQAGPASAAAGSAGGAGALGAGDAVGALEAAGVIEAGGLAGASGAGQAGGRADAHGAAGSAAVIPGTSVDMPAREEDGAADGADDALTAVTPAPAAPAPRAGSAPVGWATPSPSKASPWASVPPETAAPGKTAAVPPPSGTAAAAPAGRTGPAGPGRRRHRRRNILIGAGAVAVLIGVAIGLLLIHQHGQTSPGKQPGPNAGGTAATAQTPVAAAAGVASTGPLPSGWHWYSVSATQAGTNAGFKLAVPETWSAYSKGEAYYFEAPGNDTFLQVDLTPHTKDNMVAEARYLALLTQQQGKFPGYTGQIIRAVNIRGTVGAAWSFFWQNPDVGQVRALDLMYIARTSASQQSFAMYMTSPDAAYSSNLATFTEEMRTFQSVP